MPSNHPLVKKKNLKDFKMMTSEYHINFGVQNPGPRILAAEGATAPHHLPSWASDARPAEHLASRASLWIRQGDVQGTQQG